VPLRPVSELGLVDITDVPARDGSRNKSAVRRRASKTLADAPQTSARAKTRSTGAGKRLEGSKPRGTSKLARRAPAIAKDAGGKSNRSRSRTPMSAQARSNSNPRRMRASTATASERSLDRSQAATNNGSGGAPRSATTRTPKRSSRSASPPRRVRTAGRQTSAESRGKRNHASREDQRSRKGGRPDHTKPFVAAKIGISLLMGASLVTGGILLARAALQR
jgi:hypothetical protein